MVSGISLHGGYDLTNGWVLKPDPANGWVRTDAPETILRAEQPVDEMLVAVIAEDIRRPTIPSGLTIETADAVADNISTYGVMAMAHRPYWHRTFWCAPVLLEQVPRMTGNPGAQGVDGGNGSDCGRIHSGGVGGPHGCSGDAGGAGGAGSICPAFQSCPATGDGGEGELNQCTDPGGRGGERGGWGK